MTDEVHRPPARRKAAEIYLAAALAVALAPAVLIAAGFVGVQTGVSDWRGGLGLFAAEWAARLALVGVVTAAISLVVALLAGFGRYWRRVLAILAITTLTLGVFLWTASRGL